MLPLREPAGGKGRRRMHVVDSDGAQALLGAGRVRVLAEQVVEDAGRSEKPLACPTFRDGELGPVASPLEHEPELVDRLAVRMLAGPVDGLDDLAELFTSKPLERNS